MITELGEEVIINGSGYISKQKVKDYFKLFKEKAKKEVKDEVVIFTIIKSLDFIEKELGLE